MPGSASSAPAYVVAVGAAVERDVARRPGLRHSADQRPAPGPRHRQRRRVERGERRGVGEQVGEARRPVALRPGGRASATSRAATVRAPATLTCWPMHGAHGDLVAVDVAGHPEARVRAGPAARSPGRRRSASATATGSQSASSSRRTARRPRRCRGGRAARTSPARTRSAPGVGARRRCPAGRCRARVGRSRVRAYQPVAGRLDARDHAVGEEVEQRAAGERRAHGEPHASRVRRSAAPRRPGARAARSAWRRRPRGRVVELPHAGEAGGEGDVGEGQVGRLDQHPRGLRAPGAGQRERTGAELAGEQPGEVARACSRRGGPGPRRPRGRRRRRRSAASPGRRRRPRRPSRGCPGSRRAGSACRRGSRRAWAAAALGWKVTLCERRGARRARGPAVDAGRAHAGVEDAVEAPVAGLHRAVAGLGVELLGRRSCVHPHPRHRAVVWRESDTSRPRVPFCRFHDGAATGWRPSRDVIVSATLDVQPDRKDGHASPSRRAGRSVLCVILITALRRRARHRRGAWSSPSVTSTATSTRVAPIQHHNTKQRRRRPAARAAQHPDHGHATAATAPAATSTTRPAAAARTRRSCCTSRRTDSRRTASRSRATCSWTAPTCTAGGTTIPGGQRRPVERRLRRGRPRVHRRAGRVGDRAGLRRRLPDHRLRRLQGHGRRDHGVERLHPRAPRRPAYLHIHFDAGPTSTSTAPRRSTTCACARAERHPTSAG